MKARIQFHHYSGDYDLTFYTTEGIIIKDKFDISFDYKRPASHAVMYAFDQKPEIKTGKYVVYDINYWYNNTLLFQKERLEIEYLEPIHVSS